MWLARILFGQILKNVENAAGKNCADKRFLAFSRSQGQIVANCSQSGQIISQENFMAFL